MGADTAALAGERAYTGEWECMECGYIEAGVVSKRHRACPNCGAPAQALEFFPYEGDGENEPDDAPLGDEDMLEDEDVGLG